MFRFAFLLLALVAACTSTYRCNTCTYGIQNGNLAFNCYGYAGGSGFRTCPPDYHCYSAIISYDKFEKDPELDNRDPGVGNYQWILEGCIYKYRDPVKSICERKMKVYQRLYGTSNHECAVQTCEGDLCNEVITNSW